MEGGGGGVQLNLIGAHIDKMRFAWELGLFEDNLETSIHIDKARFAWDYLKII